MEEDVKATLDTVLKRRAENEALATSKAAAEAEAAQERVNRRPEVTPTELNNINNLPGRSAS
jgi:hypothetical protein